MYKMIIADDEKYIQEGLANLIEWESLGFEIVGIFDDGADVIEFLNSMPVDVLLTDIQMKHISGIATAQYIQENEIPCKVVFISGYMEFDMALQAIKFGVEDYVLKPSKVEELKYIFQKIKKELDEKEKNLEFCRKMEERWEEIRPILEEKFFNELIMGTLKDKNEIWQKMRTLYPEIDAERSPCAFVEYDIEKYEEFLSEHWMYSTDQFEEAIYNFLHMFDKEGIFYVIDKNKNNIRLFVILRSYRMTWEENVKLCNELFENLALQFHDIFKLNINLKSKQYFSSVFHIAEQEEEVMKLTVDKADTEMQLLPQKKLIMTNVMMGNIGTAQKIFQNVLAGLKHVESRYRQNFVVNIFSNISNFLQENNQSLFLLVHPYIDYECMIALDNTNRLAVYCDHIFDIMKTREGLTDVFDKGSFMSQIKGYVEEHIYEDIVLENVADKLFISKVHLNRIMKKQIGETFLQYVTRMKMEKAVELLREPQYKVYQVGECLGYKSSRHFSKLFYNYLGYYPSQYRKEVLKIGGANEEG